MKKEGQNMRFLTENWPYLGSGERYVQCCYQLL